MRAFLYSFICLVLATLGTSPAVLAQNAAANWPNKPVRIIIPFTAGSGLDTTTRILTNEMTKSMGPIVIENRPGGAGVLGIRAAKEAPADGYTFVVMNDDLQFITPYLYKEMPYDPLKDFVYIGTYLQSGAIILTTNAKGPATNFKDYVAQAKEGKGPYAFFSVYNVGSTMHLGFETMKRRLALKYNSVPYKGMPEAFLSVIQNEAGITAGSQAMSYINDGTLSAIAVNGTVRSPLLPNVPTLAELGAGADIFPSPQGGLAAVTGTPQAIIDRMSQEMKKAVESADVQAAYGRINIKPKWSTSAELTQFVRASTETYRPIIKELGLDTN